LYSYTLLVPLTLHWFNHATIACNVWPVLGVLLRTNVDRDLQEKEWANWMRAGLAGDAVTYRRLLDALAAYLRRLVGGKMARIGAGGMEVEDIVQETLLAIHMKRHTWRTAEAIGPWISVIARNKMIDLLRRRGRRAEVPLDDVAEAELHGDEPEASASVDVAAVLATLGERQRQIVRMMSLDGHSASTTAQQMGMTEVAVRVSLHRSLKTLAARLRETKP
jgi:RNA polymerase sigma-70 factor, ECF subfamily